jgi:DtxR family manganese transport transcriptional regulator
MDKRSPKKGCGRAAYFQETRNKRLFEIAEDYTELVDDLIKAQGQARVCDISREIGVSHVSVLKTLKRLIRDGYLERDSHKICLTSKGKEMAVFSKKKHLILSDFLRKLGVSEEIAATDVEGIEHYISPATLEAIDLHIQKHFPV